VTVARQYDFLEPGGYLVNVGLYVCMISRLNQLEDLGKI
jgi:hypothetical protein